MRYLAAALLAAAIGITAYSQEKVKAGSSVPESEGLSGAVLYRHNCAVCHGADGRGAGPAAPALRDRIPDLTLLTKRNRGEFPMFRVSQIIQSDGVDIVAHGSRDMPMWGDVFRDVQRDEVYVKLRVHNLAQYIASLQR